MSNVELQILSDLYQSVEIWVGGQIIGRLRHDSLGIFDLELNPEIKPFDVICNELHKNKLSRFVRRPRTEKMFRKMPNGITTICLSSSFTANYDLLFRFESGKIGHVWITSEVDNNTITLYDTPFEYKIG